MDKKEAQKIGENFLKKSGKSVRDAGFILSGLFCANDDPEISKMQFRKYIKLIDRRVKGEPLDKILGFTEFYGTIIPFSKHVLTPRQETELLAEMVTKEIMSVKKKCDVLDMCSGSGCIGIAIAKNTDSNVTLSDISKKAIRLSQKNAEYNDVNIRIIRSNLFDNIQGKFDIIVSNPPYIKKKEIRSLEKEVRKFDPKIALVGGDDGLVFYRKIIESSVHFLNPGGKLFLEIGYDQHVDIEKIIKVHYNKYEFVQDYSGINRFVIATKKEG